MNPPLENEGEAFLFLQPMGERAAPLRFTITEMAMRRTDGVLIPLALSFHDLAGADRIHTQSLLAKAKVPVGIYQAISIKIGHAEIMTEDGPVALQVPQDPVILPMEKMIPAKMAAAFFLTFHADNSLASHVLFRPVFSVATSSQLPIARLGYLSMPSENDLYIFHDNSMLLTGVIATGMLPRGMAMDRKRGRLYIAQGSDSVAVVDTSQQVCVGTITLRPGDDPREIAISPDGNFLVSANYGSNTVSIIDPAALVERQRVMVGDGPSAVVFSPLGTVAYSMNSFSNTISVIDTEKMTLSSTIHLEESPMKGAFSRDGTELYVIAANSPNLLLVDLKGGGVQKIFVGIGARSILVDTRSGFVYVGRQDGTISVVDPTIRAAIDSIQLGGPPESMQISDEGNCLFALVPRQHMLKKVNLISKEATGSIDLEGEGYGISLVGAR